jgi:site-specific recombinase XerD
MGATTPPLEITLQERRQADGLDADVPVVLRDGALYDVDLDRFFLDLPLSGIRSHHSLRAYGYDVVVWARFLAEARGKSVWAADRDDVAAFHRVRRRGDAGTRITAASWNRSVASLDRLYRWAEREGLVGEVPFTHRAVWHRGPGSGRLRRTGRNEAYERGAHRSDMRFVGLEDYGIFRDVGLLGRTPEGLARPGARDRNGMRNALFADLLITTGLRLEEASGLLVHEVETLDRPEGAPQVWFRVSSGLAKGGRGRQVLIPTRLLQSLLAYVAVERRGACANFAVRGGWAAIDRPIFVRAPVAGSRLVLREGGPVSADALTPGERARLVVCDAEGAPREAAALWLTEVGQPVRPNSWEAAFARASRRCADAGRPLRVSPHDLRHSFAVHMLAMLVQRRLAEAGQPSGEAEGYRQLLGDPLQQVQHLLGHASLTTTSIYLDHVACCTDTVDTAIEELLALLPHEVPR